jgi:hypothetical protein
MIPHITCWEFRACYGRLEPPGAGENTTLMETGTWPIKSVEMAAAAYLQQEGPAGGRILGMHRLQEGRGAAEERQAAAGEDFVDGK